ncbi:hypothetical protein [Flindersiella endophytica]
MQADALCGLAAAECDRGRWPVVESLARQALELAKSHERVKDAESTLVLARAELGAGRLDAGRRRATQAHDMFQAAGHVLGHARALRLLSELAGEDRAGRLRSAWRLFEAYGAPEAGEVAAELRPEPRQGSRTIALE